MIILAQTNMPFKKLFSILLIFFCLPECYAQETVEKKNRLTDNVTERYFVLKNNDQVKDGLYQALYKRKTAIASGKFTNGKKTGMWYFYDPKGAVIQTYDYTKDSLIYEGREDTTSDFRYLIDKLITDTDRVTKPMKAGGRYYGYLPYLGLYRTSFDPYVYGTGGYVAVVELLVSPLGRLASYKVRLVSVWSGDFDQTTNMDIKLFKEEDRKFIPATFNGEPILSRIVIKCRLTTSGGLDFF